MELQSEDNHESGYLLELNKVLRELAERTNSEEKALQQVAELKLERDLLSDQIKSLQEEKDIFLLQFNKVLQDHGKMLDEQTNLRSMAAIAKEKMAQAEHIFTENDQLKKINAQLVEESAHWRQNYERTIDKITMMQEEKQDILTELSGVMKNNMTLRIEYDDIKARLTKYEKVSTMEPTDLKYEGPSGHAATALGNGAVKKITNIVTVTDSGPSAEQKKQFKDERKKILDTKIGLGYKSGTISLKFLYIPPGLKKEGCLKVTETFGDEFSFRKPKLLIFWTTVLSCANLDAKDVDGTSDPYVKLTLNNVTHVSQIIKSNLNPIFNYECQFVIPPNFELFTQFHIEVWDYDKFSNDDLIGTTDVILDDFIEVNNKSNTEWELVVPVLRKEKPVVDKLDGIREGISYKKSGFKPKYPIALIPGLASSVLEVKEGDKYWQNERIWLSLAKINAGKVDNFKSNMKSSNEAKTNKNKDQQGDYSISKQKLLTQNRWVDHMCLSDQDNTSDPPGIKVRAMKGHQAISYLAEGFAKGIAYVMGPLIENLTAFGYDETNLVALPYDWRLPIPALETRDKYFTEVKEEIEKLYQNTGLPVVVVCHSMGNRVFQYFLNYTKEHFGGQSWIDKHIHTFYAVGAPFLGSPKILRSLISGERMGLDFFLSTSESLKFARTLGSFPCLLPTGVSTHYHPKIFTYVKKEEFNVDNKEQHGSVVLKAKNYEWIGHHITSILTLAGAERQLEVLEKVYQSNALYGGSEESEVILKAPPVKKMRHIYGVNLNTEKLYFYRYNKAKKRLALDKTFDGTVDAFPGYKFLDGIGYECSDTPQQNAKKFTGFVKNCSGDATVPYESLNYCMNWKDDLDLEVIELEKAEHRDIVSTTVFFRLLIEYVAEKSI